MLACAMAPVAFAQNDQLTINYSGKLEVGCSLVVIVSSKCNDMFIEPNVTVDGKKVVMIGSDRGFVGEVSLDKTGPVIISASNPCKKTDRTLEIKPQTFMQTLSFRDPQNIDPRGKEITKITVTATWDGRENKLAWRMNFGMMSGSKIVDTCGHADSVSLKWSGSRYEPTKAQLNPNAQYFTGWARWVEIDWYIDCGWGSLSVKQPFISP
jgi:hypothetical protein